jgi:hypothetical protein
MSIGNKLGLGIRSISMFVAEGVTATGRGFTIIGKGTANQFNEVTLGIKGVSTTPTTPVKPPTKKR